MPLVVPIDEYGQVTDTILVKAVALYSFRRLL